MGPRALLAAPTLRGLRDTPAEAGELRIAAADALRAITGDAPGALPVLQGYTTADGPLGARARDALRRIDRRSRAPRPAP
ncbi:hypothetical protein Scani_20000 [Streptomyces caniferus]|uniref:HEAT repeat domain-containing protein n=1 Tax=Streptomyces caniferus TaxID=285557 RepID=A0A640S571_9ACTN|nr:hypothetical protein [Streptomyces caniferus]GFE05732.1 hypothetical protein Scani_20000 [Streptomyces caniferus]